MNSFVVKPLARPVYEIQPEHSHSRLSLRSVLKAKFLRWVDKATPRDMLRAFLNAGASLVVFASILILVLVPQLFLGVAFSVVKWHHFGLEKFAFALFALSYSGTAIKLCKKLRVRRSAGNQNTYRGIPIDELASFLLETGRFTRDDAMRRLKISQDKHDAISKELEHHQVLVRGENNARVMNQISREQLVRQLTEKFPLAFHNGEWAEKKGGYEIFLRDKERAEQKEREQVERKERKVERLDKKIGELTAFQKIMAGQVA